MEYNTYNQPRSDLILCPQITVWIIFVLELIYVFNIWYFGYLIALLLQLAIALCVSFWINKRNYGLYRVGQIISTIISVIGTFVLLFYAFIIGIIVSDLGIKIKEEERGLIIGVFIVAGVLIWLQSYILMCYRRSVESLCNNSGGLYNPQIQTLNNQYNQNNQYNPLVPSPNNQYNPQVPTPNNQYNPQVPIPNNQYNSQVPTPNNQYNPQVPTPNNQYVV